MERHLRKRGDARTAGEQEFLRHSVHEDKSIGAGARDEPPASGCGRSISEISAAVRPGELDDLIQVDHRIRRRGTGHGQRGRRKSVRPCDREHDVDDADELPPGLPRVTCSSNAPPLLRRTGRRPRARARRGRPGMHAAGRHRPRRAAPRRSRCSRPGTRRRPAPESERPRALHLGDDEHPACVQYREVAGLPGCGRTVVASGPAPPARVRAAADCDARARTSSATRVYSPDCGIADQVAAPLQRLEHPEDLADRTARLARDLRLAEAIVAVGESSRMSSPLSRAGTA